MGNSTKSARILYSLGYSGVRALRAAARRYGASESEMTCIERLDRGTADDTDVRRLAPLAELADLPWSECDVGNSTKSARILYSLGYSGVRALRAAARRYGASESEMTCIERLDRGTADDTDVRRLAPLAELADLPWSELYPREAAHG